MCKVTDYVDFIFPLAGPVAQNVKDQHAKTTAEFSNLAASRQTPADPAATGQPLTHYHSFFSELLSWNNPRMHIPTIPPPSFFPH